MTGLPRILIFGPEDTDGPCEALIPNAYVQRVCVPVYAGETQGFVTYSTLSVLPCPESLEAASLHALLYLLGSLDHLSTELPAVCSNARTASLIETLSYVLCGGGTSCGVQQSLNTLVDSLPLPTSGDDQLHRTTLHGLWDSLLGHALIETPFAKRLELLPRVLGSKAWFASRLAKRQDSGVDLYYSSALTNRGLSSKTLVTLSLPSACSAASTESFHLVQELHRTFGLVEEENPRTLLASLPTFLSLFVSRQESSRGKPLEFPLSLDCSALCPKTRHSLYTLHGFVTQSNGQEFITYTRLRNGRDWFRFTSSTTTSAMERTDLIHGSVTHQIKSLGVLFLIYALVPRSL